MIIALKKVNDPKFSECIERAADVYLQLDGGCVFLYVTMFRSGMLRVSSSHHLNGDNPCVVEHYYGPIKDVKTGVIANGRDIAVHVQKTRAFVTIANA